MIKTVPINGKNITFSHNFKTRYSKLLKLHESLHRSDLVFPEKKIFGSKCPIFLNKRMKQLEEYLNEASRKRVPNF